MLKLLNAAPTIKNGEKAKYIYDFCTQELGIDNMDALKLFVFRMQKKIGPGTYAADMIDNLYSWMRLGESVGRLAGKRHGESPPPSASRWLWLLA